MTEERRIPRIPIREHVPTTARVREYWDACGSFCPRCKSDDIQAGAIDAEGDEAWQSVTCNDCQYEWFDIFLAAGIEVYPDEETEDPVFVGIGDEFA